MEKISVHFNSDELDIIRYLAGSYHNDYKSVEIPEVQKMIKVCKKIYTKIVSSQEKTKI